MLRHVVSPHLVPKTRSDGRPDDPEAPKLLYARVRTARTDEPAYLQAQSCLRSRNTEKFSRRE